jgi:putative membrane protein
MERLVKNILPAIVSAAFIGLASSGWAADKIGAVLLRDAIQGNLTAIMMGQLGQEKAQSPDVRAFAATVMVDHWASNEQAENAAKQIGIAIPTEPSSSQKLSYEHMSKLSDKALDRAFVGAMIVFYKTIIPRFKNEAKKTNDPIGIFAHEELPRLQEHLDAAQKLQSGI